MYHPHAENGSRSTSEISTQAHPSASTLTSNRTDPSADLPSPTTSPQRPHSAPRTTRTHIPAHRPSPTKSTRRSVAPSINRNRSNCTSGTTATDDPPRPARFIRKPLTPDVRSTSRRSPSPQRTNTTDGITTRSTSRRRPSRHTLTSRCKATYTS